MPRGIYKRKPPMPVRDRLESLYVPITECGCWIFTGCLTKLGYGRFTVSTNKNLLAHRVSYAIFVDDPGDQHVLHRCDIPSCINPDHLFLGTHQENMADMAKKKRAQAGERHTASKLTANDVREIRKSDDGCVKLARKYGVAVMTILDAKAKRTWAHVE